MAEDQDIQPTQPAQLVPAETSRVTIVEHGMTLHVHRITDDQLDEFVSGYGSLNIAFCTLCIGLLAGFGITLWTVELPDKSFATFAGLVLVSAIGSVYFGIRGYLERRRLNALRMRLLRRANEHATQQ